MDYPHFATYVLGPATLLYAAVFYAAIKHAMRKTVIGMFIGLVAGFLALALAWVLSG
jgi:hypothetical protein